MPLTIAVSRERAPGEHRVALVPETAKKFAALGASLRMEQSAGTESHFLDSDYAGIALVDGIPEAYGDAGLILRVTPPSAEEIAAMPEGAVLIGLLKPFESRERLAALNARKITAFALELLEAGILTEKDFPGMPSDIRQRFYYLLQKMAFREGIGDVLAHGTSGAAAIIGKGAEKFDHNAAVTNFVIQPLSAYCTPCVRLKPSRVTIVEVEIGPRLPALSAPAIPSRYVVPNAKFESVTDPVMFVPSDAGPSFSIEMNGSSA